MDKPNPFDPFNVFTGSTLPAVPNQSLPGLDYAVDAWQRSILFLDLLRQRGNQQQEITSQPTATVLHFDHETLVSGQSLPRPINFSLSRILPLESQPPTDPTKRPLIVVDPRAGQGPGIGGFNPVSEIGVALDQGHPVYFIGFTSQPTDTQTFLDVVEGQVKFVEYIVAHHPDAPRPFAFGNCQAGYQTLMVATLRPELFGPVIVAGSPMSYWQGEHGKNPMRYAGGLLGGSWLTALTSDLGKGKFDGTWLILNFDNLNPGNWLWGKQYDVYSKVDTEGPRYLGFEKWWGDFITLNGGEIQWLVDELFIGDRFTRNQIQASDGTVLDLRNVTSPIVVLTSQGDNISPPPQTLGWILDLYRDVDDLRAHGRTIVYSVNPHVGHLAIFVSPKVGGKEDAEFVRLIDEIDLLPPGLYELLIEPAADNNGQAGAQWSSRFELRTFDDIRAYGRNSTEDDRAFEAVRRVSEVNHSLYNTFLRPWVQATATPQMAQLLFDANPLRLSYTMFADSNPFMRGVAQLAEHVRANRQAADIDNPFLQWQTQASDKIVEGLDAWRDARDQIVEQTFFALYGSPVLQGLLGMNQDAPVRQVPGLSPQERARLEAAAKALIARVAEGGINEALVRSVIFVLAAERVLQDTALVTFNAAREHLDAMPRETFKALLREQYYLLLLKRQEAIDALPALVEPELRAILISAVRTIVGGAGQPLTPAQEYRLAEVAKVLDVSPDQPLLSADDVKRAQAAGAAVVSSEAVAAADTAAAAEAGLASPPAPAAKATPAAPAAAPAQPQAPASPSSAVSQPAAAAPPAAPKAAPAKAAASAPVAAKPVTPTPPAATPKPAAVAPVAQASDTPAVKPAPANAAPLRPQPLAAAVQAVLPGSTSAPGAAAPASARPTPVKATKAVKSARTPARAAAKRGKPTPPKA